MAGVKQIDLGAYRGARVWAYVVRYDSRGLSRSLELYMPREPKREVSLDIILGGHKKDVRISTWDVQVTLPPPHVEQRAGQPPKITVRVEYASAVLTSAAVSGGRTIVYLNRECR